LDVAAARCAACFAFFAASFVASFIASSLSITSSSSSVLEAVLDDDADADDVGRHGDDDNTPGHVIVIGIIAPTHIIVISITMRALIAVTPAHIVIISIVTTPAPTHIVVGITMPAHIR